MLLRCIIFAITLIWSDLADGQRYEVPEAHVLALNPKGFRVCIPHQSGIELFAFHGSINKNLPDLAAGDFSRDMLRSNHGVWCFIDGSTKLKLGDVINYWTYVQFDGLGYRRDSQKYTVTTFDSSKTPIGSFLTPTASGTKPKPASPTLPSVTNSCDSLIEELNNNIRNLHDEIKKLSDVNSSIQKQLHLMEMKNSKKALVIRGVHYDNSDLLSVVTDVIQRTLGLSKSECNVIGVERLSDGSLVFELKTVSQRNHLLNVWKSKQMLLTHVQIEDIGTVETESAENEGSNHSYENPGFSLDIRNGKNGE